MNTMDTILTRRSVRKFSEKPISEETLQQILAAAQAGPTAVNAQDWFFIVVRDKETLAKMAEVNGQAAHMLPDADMGILVCGDKERSHADYWVVDASIAAQNICLAAHALGLGAVWLGTWPQEHKVTGQTALFSLPEHAVPHSIIALGHIAEDFVPRDRKLREDGEARVHYEKW